MTAPDTAFIPYQTVRYSETDMRRRGESLLAELSARRSVRHFAEDPVPADLIELAIRSAASAPSGAHRQPWQFVAVSDADIKRQIRMAAEEEEYASYHERMPEEWRKALEPIGTDWHKPYLETVPWIVVVFEELHGLDAEQHPIKNYYVKESVGIACGLLITALHHMGLATLTHTPSPMGFLSRILNRPANERPFILFPVGYPAPDAQVPNLHRKALEQVSTWFPAR